MTWSGPISLLPALLALAVLFVLSAILAVRLHRRRKAGALADVLPPAVLARVMREPGLLRAGVREITCLACGVRGLPRLAEACGAGTDAFGALMQTILAPMIDLVLAHGGTVDRVGADGFTAFWNAPLDDPDHARNACEAAQRIARMAAQMAAGPLLRTGAAIAVEIGIATGPAIAGGFAIRGRMGYRAGGVAIRQAARLQSLAHHYGAAPIVSAETRRQAESRFAFLEMDTLAGEQGGPVRVHALMGPAKSSPKLRALSTFHDHIFQAMDARQWALARELIAQCRRLSGASQTLYDLYLTRIAYFERQPAHQQSSWPVGPPDGHPQPVEG